MPYFVFTGVTPLAIEVGAYGIGAEVPSKGSVRAHIWDNEEGAFLHQL